MKKSLLWLIIISIIALFSLVGCKAEAVEESEESETGLTYRVVEGNPFTYIEEKEQEKEQELSQEEQPIEEQQVTYGINVVSLTSPISRGSQASITINTAPNVLCTITVYYKSGPSEAQRLEPKNSDGNGNCTWS